MTESRIINVSPSLLADVIACKTKGWTRHTKGFTSKGDAIKAVAGQAFHAAAATFLAPDAVEANPYPQDRRTADALEGFHSIYDSAYARLSPEFLEPSLTPNNLHRVLARWLEMNPPSARPWKRVLSVETAFVSREWTIHGGIHGYDTITLVRLMVRPDIVVETHDGRVRFVDTKTTGWRIGDESWRDNLRLSLQVALYADAVVQKYGDRAELGGWINAVELRKLPGDTDAAPKLKKDGTPAKPRNCQEHNVPYAECGNEHAKMEFIECMLTPERMEQAVRDAEAGARDFVALQQYETPDGAIELPMEGTANGACRFCPTKPWCLSGRYPAALDSLMVYEPWIISEGVRE